MRIPDIKPLWLRRVVMVPAVLVFIPQYLYIGLRCMYHEFRFCWNYVAP